MLFGNPSLFTRIAIGKGVGFAFGLIGFFVLPILWPEASWHIRFGSLFWYATIGAVIAVFGVVTWHPVLKLPMPWWIRAPLIGGWMNLMISLIAHMEVTAMMASTFGPDGVISSPYWLVLEGALIGLLMGYLCTKYGGEGKDAVDAVSA